MDNITDDETEPNLEKLSPIERKAWNESQKYYHKLCQFYSLENLKSFIASKGEKWPEGNDAKLLELTALQVYL